MKARTVLITVLGVAVSLLIAFFGVFNVLFSDSFGLGQEIGAVVYVFVLYTLASLILHWHNPGSSLWRWVLLVPAVLFCLLVALQEQTRYGYIFLVAVAVIFGTLVGRLIRAARAKSPFIHPRPRV